MLTIRLFRFLYEQGTLFVQRDPETVIFCLVVGGGIGLLIFAANPCLFCSLAFIALSLDFGFFLIGELWKASKEAASWFGQRVQGAMKDAQNALNQRRWARDAEEYRKAAPQRKAEEVENRRNTASLISDPETRAIVLQQIEVELIQEIARCPKQ